MKRIFALILLIALISGCAEQPIACTEEAKICPDGSAVGRTGPDCEFTPCPEVETSNEGCTIDSDCVPATCCHANECVPKAEAPDCKGAICTMDCAPNTLDCGGSCKCIHNECMAMLVE